MIDDKLRRLTEHLTVRSIPEQAVHEGRIHDYEVFVEELQARVARGEMEFSYFQSGGCRVPAVRKTRCDR